MRAWNLLPRAERASRLRRCTVASGWVVSFLGGGAVAAWALTEHDASLALVQADIASTQMHLARLHKEIAELNQLQSRAQHSHALGQHVQALRQRAQRLDSLHRVTAQRWPAAVHIQEWRVEGADWRLQGQADSSGALQELMQTLAPHGPWQQAPSLVELEAAPMTAGPQVRAWRYGLQARWQESGLMPLSRAASGTTPPAASAANESPPAPLRPSLPVVVR